MQKLTFITEGETCGYKFVHPINSSHLHVVNTTILEKQIKLHKMQPFYIFKHIVSLDSVKHTYLHNEELSEYLEVSVSYKNMISQYNAYFSMIAFPWLQTIYHIAGIFDEKKFWRNKKKLYIGEITFGFSSTFTQCTKPCLLLTMEPECR